MTDERPSTADRAAFVFVHGAWHGAATWDEVVRELANRGHGAIAIDLPGAGANAAVPRSFHERPLDLAAFTTEPSPNAAVTQEERTTAVIDAVRRAAEIGNGDVVLVGHSLGGVTVSEVAETIPDELRAVVYVAAFYLVDGAVTVAEGMAGGQVPEMILADPAVVGALRLDPLSDDPEYVAKMRAFFYADLDDDQFEAARRTLHCDEPAAIGGSASVLTPERFGTIDRHYVRCADDLAITAEGQDLMVERSDAALGSTTTVHRMATSHSPFWSDPEGLAEILAEIASD
jgi:pimeloyl-ACP methyl ester carboxylesterase